MTKDALSRERIVEAAIPLLDASGADGLTFRALAGKLATGAGAIYWHVAGKDELLAAATASVLAGTLSALGNERSPKQAIRALALGLFDAIDEHPWLGAELARASWRPPMLDVFERLGRHVQALGVRERDLFAVTSAVLGYVVGAGVQNAANAQAETDRTAFLGEVAAMWSSLDPDAYPFTRKVARQLRDHDDRADFVAGIDLLLAGIRA